MNVILHDYIIVNSDDEFSIIKPRLLQPVILVDGESFPIVITAPSDAGEWQIRIFTEYSETEIALDDADYYDSEERWLLDVSVPLDTSEDLYDIEVRFTVSETDYSLVELNAVKVLDEYPESFTIIQITDTHLVVGASAIIDRITQAIHQINLLKPDLVIHTGDLTESGSIGQLEFFESLCENFQVPVYAIGGNHDLSTITTNYIKEISELYYFFEFGNVFIVMACTFGNSSFGSTQFEWIEDEISDHKTSPLKIITFHYPIWAVESEGVIYEGFDEAPAFIELCEDEGVDLVLYGHSHNDDVQIFDDTTYILTTALGGSVWAGNVHGYRILQFEDYELTYHSYDGVYLSQPLGGIEVERVPDNVRILDKGLNLKISNQLTYPLEDLMVKVLLQPLSDDDYVVANATLVDTLKTEDAWLIIAIFDVQIGSTEEVMIYPSKASAPTILEVTYPSQVEEVQSIPVEIVVENEVSGVQSVELFYMLDDLESLNRKSADYSETNEYSIRIPKPPEDTESVQFYVVARDYSGLETVSETYTISIGTMDTDGAGGIPGFPLEALAIGILIATLGLLIVKRSDTDSILKISKD